MNQWIKQYSSHILVLSLLLFGFQNCSQQPYGPGGSTKDSSSLGDVDSEMKIVLVDHLQPAVAVGETLTFSVDFENTGADSYSWYKQMPFVGDRLLATTDSAEYKIESFKAEDEGTYKVVAKKGEVELESNTVRVSLHMLQ